MFDSFEASLAEWRWGSLLSSIHTLLRVERPIRDYWDTEKMKHAKRPKGSATIASTEHQEAGEDEAEGGVAEPAAPEGRRASQ